MEHIEANIKGEIEYYSLSDVMKSIVVSIKEHYQIEKSKVFPKLDRNNQMKVHFMCERTAINFKIDIENKKMMFMLLSLVGSQEESNRSKNFNDSLESKLDVENYNVVFF